MILRSKIILLLVFIFSLSQAQNIAIGQWRVHLPYSSGVSVAEAGNKVFCATYSGGLFYVNTDDGGIEKLSKVNGLSDIGISSIRYNEYTQSSLIAYSNANLDILKSDNSVINIGDIKRKSILGKKTINNISILGYFAYLSCGFGIVVLDMTRNEIKDTYYIGPNGASLEVFDVTSDGTNFFAATAAGVYKASVSSPNLSNYAEWSLVPGLPVAKYNTIVSFNNKIYTNRTHSKSDSIYVFTDDKWTYFDQTITGKINTIDVYYNTLLISDFHGIRLYWAGVKEYLVATYRQDWLYTTDAVLGKNNIVWHANIFVGLVKHPNLTGMEFITPNGPATAAAYAMAAKDDDLWVAPGGKSGNDNVYNGTGIYHFDNLQWKTYKEGTLKDNYDPLSILIDPEDSKHIYVSNWNNGLIEARVDEKGTVTGTKYGKTNSSLQETGPGAIRVSGSAFDSKGNLWVSNSGVFNQLSVKKTDNSWKSFPLIDAAYGVNFNNLARIGNIIVDKSDQKWIIIEEKGILVYDDNGTIDLASDDHAKWLKTGVGSGNLPTLNVNSITLDDEGAIWIGTEAGVAVIYNPGNAFQSGFDVQKILIEQDGHTQYLLETEQITSIVIDGANRKWIGTKKSGVYLMSADGTKQVNHFDASNSPLLSDAIYSIAINNKSGEVYFGTDAGIISYKGTATEGGETFSDVYVYPNPVRENYTGTIAIKGLVKNASVKITDITGNLLYETRANGGQATWDGKKFNGEKAATGVYMVLCTNDDGSETFVTKILFIN